jgi:uncharacterized protein YjbI with pentapeptide repeats
MNAKKTKPAAFKRARPDLPVEFTTIRESDPFEGDREFVSIQEQSLQDQERTRLKIDVLQIEGSVLERVHLADGQFGSAMWKDVRFVACDLANIRAFRLSLVRVEFVDCRLAGFRANVAEWQDVLIQNGDVRYAQLQGGKFRRCEFEACNWQEADLQEADLSGSIFRSCDLGKADLQRAKLQHTDFRKSDVEGMTVGIGDLRGAIVDPAQAMILARLMGLQIL